MQIFPIPALLWGSLGGSAQIPSDFEQELDFGSTTCYLLEQAEMIVCVLL